MQGLECERANLRSVREAIDKKSPIYDYMFNSWRTGSVIFNLGTHSGKPHGLKPLIGKGGWLTLCNMEVIYSGRRENRLVFAGFCKDGKSLTQKQIQQMFDLPGDKDDGYDYRVGESATDKLKALYEAEQVRLLAEIAEANNCYFEQEINTEFCGRVKLDRRIELEEQLAEIEAKKKPLHMKIFEEQSKVDEERDALIATTKGTLTQRVESRQIFSIKWRVV